MDDLVAVLDAAGSAEATLVAQGHATQMAVVAAASHPERVGSLVLLNGYARFARAADYPDGLPRRARRCAPRSDRGAVGHGSRRLGSRPVDRGRGRESQEWWGRVERYVATPRSRQGEDAGDLRSRRAQRATAGQGAHARHPQPRQRLRPRRPRALPRRAHRGRRVARAGQRRPLAACRRRISSGRSRSSSPGRGHRPPEADRVLATVAFIDVAGSTERASELGDRGWRSALESFERGVQDALQLYDGTLENTAGDGVLATFDGPARAIRCASHIRDEVRRSGLQVRCGLHAGEVMRREAGARGHRRAHRRARGRARRARTRCS